MIEEKNECKKSKLSFDIVVMCLSFKIVLLMTTDDSTLGGVAVVNYVDIIQLWIIQSEIKILVMDSIFIAI